MRLDFAVFGVGGTAVLHKARSAAVERTAMGFDLCRRGKSEKHADSQELFHR